MTDYKLEDFLADENFQQWALAEQALEGSHWQRLSESTPAAGALIEEARQILVDWKTGVFQPNRGKKIACN